ncbi:MAG: CRISPR-associated endonuclease Cas2 [Bacteroidales bacterium]|nr:CRISPR-associated endonuclease Cas2 [Bacteroidales bacterium]
MTRKKQDLTAEDILQRIAEAGIKDDDEIKRTPEDEESMLDSLPERVRKILNINENQRKSTDMLFFVMYDIAHNKVRNMVAKYLIKRGCYRIQKSIFLADLPPEDFNKIKSDLAEVQAAYDNLDSILIVPISTDYLKSMKIIGQNIDVDLIMRNKNTLFF